MVDPPFVQLQVLVLLQAVTPLSADGVPGAQAHAVEEQEGQVCTVHDGFVYDPESTQRLQARVSDAQEFPHVGDALAYAITDCP